MADINVSYEEMRSSASKLDQGKTSIEEQLQGLANMINQLVSTSFKTQAASPKFQESYTQWNDGTRKAIAGLEGMSSFLQKAIQGHVDLDNSLSSGMSS